MEAGACNADFAGAAAPARAVAASPGERKPPVKPNRHPNAHLKRPQKRLMMTRREAIKTSLLAGAALAFPRWQSAAAETAATTAAGKGGGGSYPYQLPALGYAFDALEPAIDARTMEIHHDKHHAAYVKNLNAAMEKAPAELQGKTVEALIADLDAVPEAIRTAVRNNGGGHANHSLFWKLLKKGGPGKPSGDLATAIDRRFESFEGFQKTFAETAGKVFGSGWAWLTLNDKGELAVESTPNQDSPLMHGRTPLLGVDVWEHAYYLHYQNRRADYVKAFAEVIDWDFVAERYRDTLKR